ncbi:hypothetical protein DUI87_21928 [Hirundo rustica rustica]|uniref:RETREG1-3/ARL6IP-like N-terminal reticulon-homology domain-containing protein n=1 Tax=Hirundo rustica rustica TaxID=333673 RepID=A0A3M0JKZ2_HIRRU|nr:hypothetical protein DUI87_21928 [Hirundo rustica rustica]
MAAAAAAAAAGPGPGERQRRVQAVSAALRCRLGPYEPLLGAVQAALVWERPGRSVLCWAAVHGLFWFFALTSLRLLFLTALTLIVVVCLDQWKHKIWPEIGVCGVFTFLAVLGRYIPGLLLSYLLLLFVLLWPLAVYHRLGQRMYLRLEPVLQRLDFSVRGYMVARQRQRQLRGRALGQEATDDGSDSEEELAAFCPKLDDSVVAKELTISDSEHSDAEVSYTESGMFNLSRGQTPLTEGSEDLDGHSDPEESFARDLPDFPSINPEVTGIDDEDDTSIGIPSLAYRPQGTEDLQLPYEQEEFGTLPAVQNLTNNIAGFVTRGMIQLALSGAPQPGSSRSTNPQRGAKTHLRAASLDLDTDAEGDDFELLDQSELNQLDPTGSRGQ